MIHRACSILYSKRSIIVFFSPHRQGYLTEFNQLSEELQGKGVEVYAITAQTQDLVDQLRRDLNLQFKVLLHFLGNYIEWSSLSWVCLILTPWGARFSYTTSWLPSTVASICFRCLFSFIRSFLWYTESDDISPFTSLVPVFLGPRPHPEELSGRTGSHRHTNLRCWDPYRRKVLQSLLKLQKLFSRICPAWWESLWF